LKNIQHKKYIQFLYRKTPGRNKNKKLEAQTHNSCSQYRLPEGSNYKDPLQKNYPKQLSKLQVPVESAFPGEDPPNICIFNMLPRQNWYKLNFEDFGPEIMVILEFIIR
jgi:hypothetical protein